MCEPVTIGLMVGATALNAYASYQAGKAAKAAAYRNAALLDNQAVQVERRGADEQMMSRAKGEETAGTAIVAQGASGTDQDPGVEFQIRFFAEFEGTMARGAARQEAWGLRYRAENLRKEGRDAEAAGKLGAFASLLGGAAKLGGMMNAPGGAAPIGGIEHPPWEMVPESEYGAGD